MSVEVATKPRTTRRTWVAVLVITLIVAVPAFVLGPIIWPPPGPWRLPLPSFPTSSLWT